jgi:hypothetical protein
MNTFHTRHRPRGASRVHRLDPRQESRSSLALILLIGLATLSVMATTKTLSDRSPPPIPAYSQQ